MTVGSNIKNIIFDMGGVLILLNPARCVDAFRAVGARKTAAYVRDFRTEDLFLDIETGKMTTDEFCREVRRIDDIDVSNEAITAAWNALLEPSDEVRRTALLALRRRGYRLFLLSNTSAVHWEYASRELIPAAGATVGDYFERCFLSFETGKRKPSPEIYIETLCVAGIAASETLFIDDSETNLLAAEKLGIGTFHERQEHSWTDALIRRLL